MKISFLGGGNMANALIGGMLKRGFAAADITVIDPGSEARDKLVQSYGVTCLASAEALAAAGDLLMLSVKPQQMKEAVAPLVAKLGNAIVVSIAAGLDLATLARFLGGHRKIVRCMPNTPALIGAGVTGLYADPSVDAAGRAAAERILAAVGSTVWADNEAQMDAVTAISGSGPAYVFHFIEALEAAGRSLGFDEAGARRLAIDTVLGAARLAASSEDSPAVLRQKVTSKGGTTEAALASLAASGWHDELVAAVKAADDRGRELGAQLGQD